ncbi:hypothetical protein QCB44_05620 [Thiomicrorhabdus sp. zzn3]|uniref:hypothetical protein n=1 Tax=Thiomicrorhabdus sp. zzn3 TaxID=3039775 RepID=UPI0024373A6A|nr:hypothetical protein [Thiomicrorhabdus sp. zzn3]MDG6778180.1 hypothetical protein [Thiomicrorhabdus sp. zzn3]
MKKRFSQLAHEKMEHGEVQAAQLKGLIQSVMPEMEQAFVQDLSHISTAAVYAGNMAVDRIEHLRDNLYRCDYSYDWHIAWTCSGTQEAGRVTEKVRFTLNDGGEVEFKFLKFDV